MSLQHGMPLTLGQVAPDFEAETTAGPTRFSEWARDFWVVLFSHPKDFTPVNWQPGGPAIILPSISDEDAKARFPQGWKVDRPYLRWVKVD